MANDSRFVSRNGIVVSVEGILGCGKTEIVRRFRLNPDVSVVEEPKDASRFMATFEGCPGPNRRLNLLEAFRADPGKHAFAHQTFLVMQRGIVEKEAVTASFRVQERSLASIRHVESVVLKERNRLTDFEMSCLDLQLRAVGKGRRETDFYIFVDTLPTVAKERIIRRGLAEEQDVPMSYLRRLRDLYEDFFQLFHEVPVITVDGDQDLDDVFNQLRLLCTMRPALAPLFDVHGVSPRFGQE